MGKPTINDVARIAGVSKKTVSRVINRSPLLSAATRERVEAVIAQTGFVPNPQARALALRRNFLVALVYDASASPLVPQVVTAIAVALRGSGLALMVQPIGTDGTSDLRWLLEDHQPTGVILLTPSADSAPLVELSAGFGVACVPIVSEQDRPAMARLVHWLVANGHRRIGLAAGPDSSRCACERELGYLDAMADHGLDRGATLVAQGDGTFESGLEAGRLLLAVSPRPTAIVAVDDEMAAGVVHAARELGLDIPTDLSVTGFDDTPLASRLCPALSSVRVPWAAMAEAAAARLAGRLETSSGEEPELIVRGSVARLA